MGIGHHLKTVVNPVLQKFNERQGFLKRIPQKRVTMCSSLYKVYHMIESSSLYKVYHMTES